MTENCTIYSTLSDLEIVYRILEQYSMTFSKHTEDNLQSVFVGDVNAHMRITAMAFVERGDNFCRLLLSTCAFVNRLGTSKAIKKLSTLISSCELALGVVAEPSFESDKRFELIVFAIAKALNGVVFNGSDMLDSDGNAIV